MNIPGLSDQSLRDLHVMIREAMESDDATAFGPKPFGVRANPDWRRQADAFEQEMQTRGILFDEIDWS